MKNLTAKMKKMMNQKGQGAIEYILLLVVVVSIGLIFKGEIIKAVNDRMGTLKGGLDQFNVQGSP